MSTSETWSVAGPTHMPSVGGTATRCWSSRSEIDPGWRAISRGLIPNNACVPLWRYPHRNNAPQFPLSSFHAYFLKSHCFDTTEVFWVQDDELFITVWERVWRTPVATLAWRCPGTPISSDTWYSPLYGGPLLHDKLYFDKSNVFKYQKRFGCASPTGLQNIIIKKKLDQKNRHFGLWPAAWPLTSN